jgi:hypothetical protein
MLCYDWLRTAVLPDNRIQGRKEGGCMGTSVNTQVSELRDLIAQLTPRDGVHQTAIASLRLIRYSFSLTPLSGILSPTLCICAQG